MGRSYRIIDRKDNKKLTEYLIENGQLLMPMVELIEASRLAIDELIDVLGRASIEAVLQLSAMSIEQSAKELERLRERRFDDIELLIIYLDGLVFSEHHVICAVGVDVDGKKHVLGLVEGASENGASATSLLEDLVERGVDPSRKYLFVIDGSKALRSAIRKVFGAKSPVQRCRNHKVKNVCDKLPDELALQVKSVMKAAYKLPWKEGISRLKQQAAQQPACWKAWRRHLPSIVWSFQFHCVAAWQAPTSLKVRIRVCACELVGSVAGKTAAWFPLGGLGLPGG